MASSPFTPLTASSMLSAMGCEKFHRMPGILLSSVSMAEISSSLSLWKTGRHWFFGLGSTKYSVLKKPVVAGASCGGQSGACHAAEHEKNGEGERSGADADGEDAMVDGPANREAISIAQENHYRVGPFFDAVAEDHKSEDRGNQNREKQRTEQGEGNSPGHGLEEAAFDALQGEDGEIGGDDDGAGVEDRAQDFHYCIADDFQGRFLRARGEAEMADDVFDDDDGAVNDHAEIQST